MLKLILTSGITAEREALQAARTKAQQQDPNYLSRVAAWKTRIIYALSSHNATFVTATLQLEKVSNAYGKGLTTPDGAGEAQIKKANDAEKAFMEYKPEGGKLSIQELIETLVGRAQTTYSETARGLSKSYIASVIKDKDNISNQEIHTLLTELVAERGPQVIESRLELLQRLIY